MNQLFDGAGKRESAVDLVVNHIKQLLIEKKLSPGDKLPSETEISEGLCVSRGSVREAMKILSAFGLLDIKAGNGTYVTSNKRNDSWNPFLFSFFAINPNVEDLYELRTCFETDILELIIQHASENQSERQALTQNLNTLQTLILAHADAQEIRENDLEFHRLFGTATHNVLMEQVYNFIIDFMEPSITATHKKQNGEIVYRVHKSILDVIAANDRTQIRTVIENSVDTWSVLQPAE